MKVSVVIAVYNRQDCISACLQSVLRQSFRNFEIIVVNDGSTDSTLKEITAINDERIRIISHPHNQGLCAARNTGVDSATGEIICFTDSDCVVDVDWLTNLIEPFKNSKDIKIVGGAVIDPESKNYWQRVNKGSSFVALQSGFVKTILGCNMAFRADFLKSNIFDVRLFFAGDEIDRCFCCSQLGGKIYYTDAAKVTHYHRYSLKSAFMQQFRYGYSWIYVNSKHKRWPILSLGCCLMVCFILTFLAAQFGFMVPMIPAGCAVLFLILVLYFNVRQGKSSVLEILYTYPGKVLLFLSFCIGQIYGLVTYRLFTRS